MSAAPTTPASVRVGEELELAIASLAYGGEGIGRHGGLVVFVAGALPGDRVSCRVQQVKSHFARAELLAVLEPSPDRVAPFCPHAEECGGCSWQHLAYPAQIQAKQLFVQNALQHVGRIRTASVPGVIKAVPQTGYRHKIQIPLQAQNGDLAAGFYATKTHRVVPIAECPVQPVLGNRVLKAVRELAGVFGYRGYDETSGTGDLRHLVIRLGHHTKEALAILVTPAESAPRLDEFSEQLIQRVPELVGVVQNVNTETTNVILGRVFKSLAGRPYIYEEIEGLKFRISAGSFFQVNPFQLPQLLSAVGQAAALSGHESVVDLYCGVGLLTLSLARQARLVVGVEEVSSAVEDAQANKHLNGFSQAEFLAADAAAGFRQLAAKGLQPDVVVLDPPRKGVDPKVLNQLCQTKPKRVVMVSCNPVTLARDLARLASAGYRVLQAQPLDFFPHTYHVETVATLVRKNHQGKH
ncbi:MAG: 23S rRNA (uracil(1939)-C(5))-methyltransferase RlmD [candidate division FCPU426 bacterium]